MARDPSVGTRSIIGWSRSPLLVVAALALNLAACSLDVRSLSVAHVLGDAAGANIDASTSPDARSPEPDGATSDAAPAPPSVDAGNPDGTLCGARDAGCSANVVLATSFDRDTVPWVGESGISLAWQASDAGGARPSGSMTVSNVTDGSSESWTFGSAERCAPAPGSGIYAFTGQVFIPNGQGAGGAGLGVSFFSASDCTGAALATYDTPPSDKTDQWIAVSGDTTAPASTESVQIRLVVLKPLSEPSFEASFDEVRLTRR